MRWNNLLAGADEAQTLPGYRDPAVIRRFDAPEALDTRFYEVHARSALNRVPKQSRMPFRWTINPYRGCTHACTYCVRGDTPVLLADGTTRPIEQLVVGDAIYGTRRVGVYRRYVHTKVLAHWRTEREAYRVRLEDGTELVASADHRFLTGRGWKFVTGAEQGAARRPHLTPNDKLMGTGAFAAGPIDGRAIKTAARLGVVAVEPLGERIPMYDITTGTGDFIANGVVSHNCFARPTHKYLDFGAGRDFEREIVVKVNAPEVLRVELAKPSWTHEHVALGTNTDPYQWVEGRYRLMPEIWQALLDSGTPCSVLTKSPLLLRDIDLLRQLAERVGFTANVSVPTLDEKAWRQTEPHTPHPRKRLEAIAELTRAGIPTGVLIAPLMPGVNDSPEQVQEILDVATAAGAKSVAGITLHLRGEVRGIFMDWLRAQRPDLVERYERLYARGAYASKDERERHSRMVRRGGGARRIRSPQGRDPAPQRGGPGAPERPVPAPVPPASQESLF